jgi:hypothetical protein
LSTVPPITRIVLYKLWLGYFEREGPVEGRLLGVDHRQREMPSAVVEVVLVSLLGDDGQVRSFELHDLASIQVLDEAVRRDLDPFLRIQLSAKLKDARRFAIAAQGEGRRTLRLGYTVEVPGLEGDLPPRAGRGKPPADDPGVGDRQQHPGRGLGGRPAFARLRPPRFVRPRPRHPALHQAARGDGQG